MEIQFCIICKYIRKSLSKFKSSTTNVLEMQNKLFLALCQILKQILQQWYFVTKIVLTYCEKNCSSDQEKLLKFEAEGREFAKFFRSLEQFIQTVKGQNNFW